MPASYNPQDISDCSVLKTQWQPTPLSLVSVNLCQRFVSRLFCSVHNSWYNGHSDIMYVHIWRSQLWKQILFVFEGADFLLWQNDILILVIFECHHFRSVINGWRICVLLLSQRQNVIARINCKPKKRFAIHWVYCYTRYVDFLKESAHSHLVLGLLQSGALPRTQDKILPHPTSMPRQSCLNANIALTQICNRCTHTHTRKKKTGAWLPSQNSGLLG